MGIRPPYFFFSMASFNGKTGRIMRPATITIVSTPLNTVYYLTAKSGRRVATGKANQFATIQPFDFNPKSGPHKILRRMGNDNGGLMQTSPYNLIIYCSDTELLAIHKNTVPTSRIQVPSNINRKMRSQEFSKSIISLIIHKNKTKTRWSGSQMAQFGGADSVKIAVTGKRRPYRK